MEVPGSEPATSWLVVCYADHLANHDGDDDDEDNNNNNNNNNNRLVDLVVSMSDYW